MELRRVRLPFRRPVTTALGAETFRHVLFVRVTTPEATGWGECAAMAAPSYTEEYVDGAAHVLLHHLVPLLLTAPGVEAAGVGPALSGVRGHRMAKAALEMAVLDAELRVTATSLASYLGATEARVEAGVVVGIAASVPALLDAVAEAVAGGFRRVKLKIAPGWDVEPVRAVRERFGDDLLLQADANGAYTTGDAAHLGLLDPFGLLLVEQPLPPEDLAGSAELARRIATPVCLDESVTSARAAAAALSAGAAAVLNVKPGRVGGYLEARRVHDVCRAAGVPVWCGGMFETGLARAANLALSGLPGFSLPGDLAPPSWYLAGDVVRRPLVARDGWLDVPDAPGIGADVDVEALDRWTVAVDVVPVDG